MIKICGIIILILLIIVVMIVLELYYRNFAKKFDENKNQNLIIGKVTDVKLGYANIVLKIYVEGKEITTTISRYERHHRGIAGIDNDFVYGPKIGTEIKMIKKSGDYILEHTAKEMNYYMNSFRMMAGTVILVTVMVIILLVMP